MNVYSQQHRFWLITEIRQERLTNEFNRMPVANSTAPEARTRSKTIGAAWKHAMAVEGRGCKGCSSVRNLGTGRTHGAVRCRRALRRTPLLKFGLVVSPALINRSLAVTARYPTFAVSTSMSHIRVSLPI